MNRQMHHHDPRPHLVLFFTRRTSLQTWDRAGILQRELALYHWLARQGIRVTLVTYGGSSERSYRHALGSINAVWNRWGLPRRIYEQLIPWLHARVLKTCSWIKTNQTLGSQFALRAARHWRRPLIARCGYMWSEFASREHGPDSPAARRAGRIERQVFLAADRVVVTTPAMAQSVIQRWPHRAPFVEVIGNYVDTERFCPDPQAVPRYDVAFVGRLVPQKNVTALLHAARGTSWRVLIVGQAPEPEWWLDQLHSAPGTIEWRPSVPHYQLPELFNQARTFVLPSWYEGHPKVLLEAMACGRPVIAADAPGIRTVIRHGHTGWLCPPQGDALRQAVTTLLENPLWAARLGQAARAEILRAFSLPQVGRSEYRLLMDVHRQHAAQRWAS